jgi:hypothetical protein
MNKEDIFNECRLAWSCDIADLILRRLFVGEIDVFDADGGYYTEKAQDEFNFIQEQIEEAMIGFAQDMIRNKVGLKTLNN